MGNHFHLLVRMRPDTDYSDSEIKRRYQLAHGDEQRFEDGQIPF
jgi:hypothetical protein